MTENEVSDSYRSRFSNYKQVNQYINDSLVDVKNDEITLNILVIPSNIEHRMIDASDTNELEKLKSVRLPTSGGISGFPNWSLGPSSRGFKSKSTDKPLEELEIHRNSCVQFVGHYNRLQDGHVALPYTRVADRLLQVLEFSYGVLSDHNYYGDVKIVMSARCLSGVVLPEKYYVSSALDKLDAKIEREFSLSYVGEKYEQIAASVMDELFNHFGILKCNLFDEQGNYLEK